MAKLNLEYYNNENGYSDGAIEDELLEIVKSTNDFDEVLRKDNRWPLFYHLSPLRQNILNWYPFNPDATLLEVGGGCGALTGLFCQRVKEVKSIELTQRRGNINYERNKHFSNLEIILGNFNNIKLQNKFDYIVLNGVLEYAGSFTNMENPYKYFLAQIKELLKPTGVLLIAIENRFGLKYFNGAIEDHTSNLFSGINNYPDVKEVKTFTKNELRSILKDVGYNKLKFFYPVPDYKFPEVIYSDDSLDLINFNIRDKTYNADRLRFYDENSVQEGLYDEGIIEYFFNSFLVEVKKEECVVNDSNVIYAKMGMDRKPSFQIVTKIVKESNGDLKVIKSPMRVQSNKHIEKMYSYYLENNSLGKMKNAKLDKRDNSVEIEYIKGKTLEKILIDMLKVGQKEKFEHTIQSFYSELMQNVEDRDDYCNEKFQSVFGKSKLEISLNCKFRSNIDLIFSNIILKDEKYYIIDYEWIFDLWIPQEYVAWRSLYYLYIGNKIVQKNYRLEELLSIIHLDEKLHSVFTKWDDFFGNNYVRDNINEIHEKNVLNIEPELSEFLKESKRESALYIDFGDGFSEQHKIISEMHIQKGVFKVEFKLETENNNRRIHSLRWDPLEQSCQLKNISILNSTNDLELNANNLNSHLNDWDIFITKDPNYLILGDYENLSSVLITGEIEVLSIKKAQEISVQIINEMNLEKTELKNGLDAAQKSYEEEMKISKQYKMNYDDIANSNFWKATSVARKVLDKVKATRN